MPKCLNPEWNQAFEIPLEHDDADSADEILSVQVWDKDTFGFDDLIGEFVVHLSTIAKSDDTRNAATTATWHTLLGICSESASGVGETGKVLLSLRIGAPAPPPVQMELEVSVGAGKGLKAMDRGGTSDPYVTLQVGSQAKPFKTRVVKKNLNPQWHETFQILVSEDAVACEALSDQVCVCMCARVCVCVCVYECRENA